MANTFTKIATYTVSNNTTGSITFSSIPQTYTDLQIFTSTRALSGGLNDYIRFNTDSSSIYSWTEIYGTGSSTASDRTTGDSVVRAGFINESSFTANVFNNATIYISNYTSSNYKQVIVDGAMENNATATYMGLKAGLYRSTSAITSILYFSDATYLAPYSEVTLYGIKNS